MKFRELRRILQQVVIAGLPAAMGCDVGTPIGSPTCQSKRVEQFFDLQRPNSDARLQLRIESCRVDVDACPDLCTVAMKRLVDECNVSFQADTAQVKVAYQVTDGLCGSEGRKPMGLVSPHGVHAQSAAGAWLAQAAWLEAASVHAFVRLARELRGYDAPEPLVRLALSSARDEVRHTAIMRRLAARYGGVPPAVEVALPEPRSLEAFALENATEGCVRETWGAVLALWQSHAARDPEVRAAFAAIAKDEARHAALAWMVDQWVSPMLDAPALARIGDARQAAVRELFGASDELSIATLGLPDRSQLAGLLARTNDSLWQGGRSCHA